MKAASLLVVLALLAVSCAADPASISTVPTVYNSIFIDAHTCCVSACTAEQKAALQARADAYDGPDAQSTRELVAKAVAGTCANGKSKKAAGDFAIVTCTPATIDVANMDQTVTCMLNLKFAAGIYTTYVYAANNNGTKTSYPDNYYYSDVNATKTSFLQTYVFNVPRYSMYGIWNVSVVVYGPGYLQYVGNSTAYFNVLKTVNDVNPPMLTALSGGVINVNDVNKQIAVSASDDVSGVTSITIYVQNSTTTVAYGTWYAPYGNSGYLGLKVISTTISLYAYNGAITPGTYDLQVYLGDAAGFNMYMYGAQLASMGFPSTVTFASSNCAAGSARPYNTLGVCTVCPSGTYAAAGAFRCATCMPGTYNFGSGAGACTACPAGTSGIGASWPCSPCAPGSYQYATGSALCMPCEPGFNTTATGATSCGYCPAGTFSTGGASTCTLCPVGTFSQGYYTSSCSRCRPGTFSNVVGASSCSACPSGTYSGLGQTSCTSCPAPRVMSIAGSNSQLNCY